MDIHRGIRRIDECARVRFGNYVALQRLVVASSDEKGIIRRLANEACHRGDRRLGLNRVEALESKDEASFLLIIDAGYHPESVRAFAKNIEALTRASDVFLGIEIGGVTVAAAPTTGEQIRILSAEGDEISTVESFAAIAMSGRVLKTIMALPHLRVKLLCNPESVEEVVAELRHRGVQFSAEQDIFQVSWVEERNRQMSFRAKRRRYDPVWAQINEASVSAVSALEERLDRVGELARRPARMSGVSVDFRLPISVYRENLASMLKGLNSLRHSAAEFRLSLAGQIDVISNYSRHVEKQIRCIEQTLLQRVREFDSEERADERLELALCALDGVAHYCGRVVEHVGGEVASSQRHWAVMLGEAVRLVDAPEFRGIFPFVTTWLQPGAVFAMEGTGVGPEGVPLGVVEFPRSWAFRAGSFPLIAWALADEYPRAGWVHDAKKELKAEIEGDFRRLKKKARTSFSLENEAFDHLTNSVFKDLVAISMMGPAYVYALARFGLLGRIGSLDWQQLGKYVGVIGVGLLRLRLNLRMLRTLGLDIPFHTAAFKNVRQGVSGRLLRDILRRQGTILQQRYNGMVQEAVTHLIRGEVGAWPPDIVLNALWRGVIEGSAYANEGAVFWSLVLFGTARPDMLFPDHVGGA